MPLDDPREIRKHLNEVSRNGCRVDGKRISDFSMNAPSAMLRNVLIAAEIQGYSGEDLMTVLAYNALLRYEDVLDRLIEQLNITPTMDLK